jgi:hypothetical protein
MLKLYILETSTLSTANATIGIHNARFGCVRKDSLRFLTNFAAKRDPKHFVPVNRQTLESPYICRHLYHWDNPT